MVWVLLRFHTSICDHPSQLHKLNERTEWPSTHPPLENQHCSVLMQFRLNIICQYHVNTYPLWEKLGDYFSFISFHRQIFYWADGTLVLQYQTKYVKYNIPGCLVRADMTGAHFVPQFCVSYMRCKMGKVCNIADEHLFVSWLDVGRVAEVVRRCYRKMLQQFKLVLVLGFLINKINQEIERNYLHCSLFAASLRKTP